MSDPKKSNTKSEAVVDAKHAYEHERSVAYRQFYKELEKLRRLTLAQAFFTLPIVEGLPPAPPTLFERSLFGLYRRIVIAFKRSLIDQHIPTSKVIQRLAQQAETVFREIYVDRIREFAERASERPLPEFLLPLIPENARGHTAPLFRKLEEEILSMGDPRPEETYHDAFKAVDEHTPSTKTGEKPRLSPDVHAPCTEREWDAEQNKDEDENAPCAVSTDSNSEARAARISRSTINGNVADPARPPMGLGVEPTEAVIQAIQAHRRAEESNPELLRKRLRREADLQAYYDRQRGRNLEPAHLQETLIRDARRYAESYLAEADSPIARLRITRTIWDLFIPKHPHQAAFRLTFEELHVAVWTEGWPSLRERAEVVGMPEPSVSTSERSADNGRTTGVSCADPQNREDVLDRNASGQSLEKAPPRKLSARGARVHEVIGPANFQIMTNAEIMKDRNFRRRLRDECKLSPGDAEKSCLDRIRKAHGYPLSREISKKRSGQVQGTVENGQRRP